MDLGVQPRVLVDLIQVEEMLIARGSWILQVMHSIGDQFKYRGHTIRFPKEIKCYQSFPWQIKDIDIMIVIRKKRDYFTIRKDNPYNSLTYKIKHNPFYHDVWIDYGAHADFLETTVDV